MSRKSGEEHRDRVREQTLLPHDRAFWLSLGAATVLAVAAAAGLAATLADDVEASIIPASEIRALSVG